MADSRFRVPDDNPSKGAALAVPRSRSRRHPAEIGLYVFLASLSVLFAASLIGYLFTRLTGERLSTSAAIHLPWIIWLSTLSLLTTSFMLHRSLAAVRREKQSDLRRWLLTAFALGCVFLSLQTVSVLELLRLHWIGLERSMTLYGIVMVLVGLHAAHVLGGLVALSVVTVRGFQYRYDHECYRGLRICVIYWHFLDVVWLVMLATFVLTS